LDIQHNDALTSLPELSGLTNLINLSIYDNDGLTSLPELSELTNLSSLSFEYNDALTSLPELSELTNLSALYIDNNDALTSLPDLSGLTNLCTLFIVLNDNLECVGGYPEQLTIDESWPPVCTYQVGDFAEGGIVFYVDETGQHGLVAAPEDLPGTYEWGCMGVTVNGADGTLIGTGFQNTMDIINQGCTTENGGITAAQAALEADINGYSDWYLPSRGELYEMYSTIGNVALGGNIGNFLEDGSRYWCSSESIHYHFAFYLGFNSNSANHDDFNYKFNAYLVRPIRSF
jgi:hypothetical protein